MRVTVDEVMSWSPCKEYTHERVTNLFAGRKTVSAMNILDMDIPDADKLWAVLRRELIPAPKLHELACRFAEAVLSIYEREYPDDKRPRLAIEAKRAWLRREITDEQLRQAWEAAREAAWIARAAWEAAWEAAWIARAAGEAAWEAARAAGEAAWAAREAAWAAGEAAWEAAWEAAREAQTRMVREILEEP